MFVIFCRTFSILFILLNLLIKSSNTWIGLMNYSCGELQTYMQLTTERSEEVIQKMKLKERDIELWITRNELDDNLRRQIMPNIQRIYEQNMDVDAHNPLPHLPMELRKDIKRYLCLPLLKKVSDSFLSLFLEMAKKSTRLKFLFTLLWMKCGIKYAEQYVLFRCNGTSSQAICFCILLPTIPTSQYNLQTIKTIYLQFQFCNVAFKLPTEVVIYSHPS